MDYVFTIGLHKIKNSKEVFNELDVILLFGSWNEVLPLCFLSNFVKGSRFSLTIMQQNERGGKKRKLYK